MHRALFSLLVFLSFQATATPFQPVHVDANLLIGRGDSSTLANYLQRSVAELNDSRWNFVTIGKPSLNVLLDREVYNFIDDFKSVLMGKFQAGAPGSEALFNIANIQDPPFEKLSELQTALEFATGVFLKTKMAPIFFNTPSGHRLRAIFSKLRSGPQAPIQVSNLTRSERELLAIYIGALYWRMRGAGLLLSPDGKTQSKRRYYVGYAFRAIGQIFGRDFGSIADDWVFRLQMKGWGKYYDIGNHNPPNSDPEDHQDQLHDLIFLIDRGLYQVDSTLSTIKKMKGIPDNLKIAGLQMGACYFLPWTELKELKDLEPPPPPPLGANLAYPTHWGEYCFGAALAQGLARALD